MVSFFLLLLESFLFSPSFSKFGNLIISQMTIAEESETSRILVVVVKWRHSSKITQVCPYCHVISFRSRINEVKIIKKWFCSLFAIRISPITHLVLSPHPLPPPHKKVRNPLIISISPGYYNRPKRNWKQCLCKIWGRHHGAIWEMCDWRM